MTEIKLFFSRPERVIDHLKKIWDSSNIVSLKNELEDLTKKINSEKQKEDRYLALYGSGKIDQEKLFAQVEKCKQIYQGMEAKENEIQLQINEIQNQEIDLDKLLKSTKDIKQISKEVFKSLDLLSLEEKREMLKACFDERLKVRILAKGEVEECPKKEAGKPFYAKGLSGRMIKQVIATSDWSFENYQRMLNWLKSNHKLAFNNNKPSFY